MRVLFCISLVAALCLGCDDTDDDEFIGDDAGIAGEGGEGGEGGMGETPVIFGTWVDPFGTDHVITETEWTQTFDGATSTYLIVSTDPDTMTIVAQNGADNEFSPDLFSRFDWTQVDDRLFFCQSAFDKESAEDAAAAPAADPSDPTTSGCGGMFSWSELLMP